MRHTMNQFIYADNASTTRLDPDAFEAMKPFLLEKYGNPSQTYSFSRSTRKALCLARETIASALNALSEEVYFTSGGTESNNWAIKGTLLARPDYKGIVTSQAEHHAILNTCRTVERCGGRVTYLRPEHDGTINPSQLGQSIDGSTNLVSIMLANNVIGTILPVEKLCSIAHDHGVLFHTDAVQAVGHVPIDVQELGVDLLSASAHKFNGPKGIGFMYIRKGTQIVSCADGGAQESGMRAGTENVPLIVGMATALKNNCKILEDHRRHMNTLSDILLKRLKSSKFDCIRNGINHLPGLISLSFRGADGEGLLHCLDLKGICVSTGSACDSKNTQISHVLKAIGLPAEYAKGTIRISLGKDNTEDDIESIIIALTKILL